MVSLLVIGLLALEHKSKHFHLGVSEALTLAVDLNIDVYYVEHDPTLYEQEFRAHFYAKDLNGKIVDEKFVKLGPCFRSPNSLIIEDRFRKGYKQFFISLQYGGISSYLFAFKNRRFYTAYMNNEARVVAKALPSRKPIWKIEESDTKIHYTLSADDPNSRTDGHMIWTTWQITPESKPILKLGDSTRD